ncbi:MAG: fibronectin type III domain-containing protein, partial [bacterium]
MNAADWAATGTTAWVGGITATNILNRKPGSPNGNGTDTNDCPADFTLTTVATPRNSASPAEPAGADTTPPAAPTGLAVADVPADQGGALQLNWTANTEPDRKDYGVYRALASGALGTKTLITRVNDPGTTHQDGGLVNNTTYYYQLTARDTTLNESGGSTEVSAYPVDNLTPAAPSGLALSDVPADQGTALRLNWTANAEGDLKDYGVYRALASGALGTKTLITRVNAPGTTREDGGLVANTTYYYQLTARDTSLNESAGSGEASAYPADNLAPAAPAGLGVTNPATGFGGALNLSWTAN